ncbi:hypothetical protein [Desulfosporosinus sp. BICA1-9]|nr:hypothetical protein [Desulfosporosinus sp. BICA1-9]
MLDRLVREYAQQLGVTEQLKAENYTELNTQILNELI